MTTFINKHFKLIFISIIIVGLLQGCYYAYFHKLLPDQAQLLQKGILLAHLNQWVHYGNAVTGGGSVPGSLSAALVGFPLKIWDHPMSPQIVISLLQLAGVLFFNSALKPYFSPVQRLIFLILFWLSPWRASKAVLWNPSYLFFAAGLHFWSAQKLFQQPKKFWYCLLHVLAIGFAFQLHTSSILLAIISLYLWVRKVVKVNWSGVLTATVLVGLSLVPFVLESMTSNKIIPVVDKSKGDFFYGRGFAHTYLLAKGVLYWPRFTSFVFPSYIFKYIGFADSELFLKYVFNAVRYLFAAASMLLSLWGFGWLLKGIWQKRGHHFQFESLIDHYIFAALIAMVIAVGISPAEMSHWHLILLMPIAQIAFCQFLFTKFNKLSKKVVAYLMVSICLYFISYNIFAVHFSNFYFSTEQHMGTEYSEFRDQQILKHQPK